MNQSIAIVGSGPAGLMAADQLLNLGYKVSLFERRGAIGRKLFIAGSSGLNITNSAAVSEFAEAYSGQSVSFWSSILGAFSPAEWISFIETHLDQETFLGTSGRYFIKSKTALRFVRNWRNRLSKLGCQFFLNHELSKIQMDSFGTHLSPARTIQLHFKDRDPQTFDAVILALGGGAWETEYPIPWPQIFSPFQIQVQEFEPSNVGWEIQLSSDFFKEAEGLPLKNIVFSSNKGSKKGDLVVTSYGLEGTPIYQLGTGQICYIDLKPDLTHAEILNKLSRIKENLSPLRRVKKALNLSKAGGALLFHSLKGKSLSSLEGMVAYIKKVPVELTRPRPLSESISSTGGLPFLNLDDNFMIKNMPGVFATGEMLDWDAPTGGYLIQGSVSLARAAAKGVQCFLSGPLSKSTSP